MSNHVSSLVRKRTLGVGLTAKSVILLMSDFSSDDGSGIWASKARMARELETTDRTIQRTIKILIDAGFIQEIGRKKHQNGETFEYKIDVDRVANCPLSTQLAARKMTPDTLSPPTHCHPTPDGVSPHGATVCHPNQIQPPLNQRSTPVVPKADDVVLIISALTTVDAAESFVAYRKRHKSRGLSLIAAHRLSNSLQQILNAGHDPTDALGLAEERGWASVNLDWYENAKGNGKNGQPSNKQSSRANFDAKHREYARQLSAGEIDRGPDPSDPFGGR